MQRVAMRFPAKITSSCIWVFHTCWLSYFTFVCLWCGLTVGALAGRCTVTWWPNFVRWVDLLRKPQKKKRNCIEIDWLSYFTFVCLWCGLTVGALAGRCTVTWWPNFVRWVDLLTPWSSAMKKQTQTNRRRSRFLKFFYSKSKRFILLKQFA